MTSHSHDRFLWGLILVVLGVLFLLRNFGYPIGDVWKWWPIILVLVGIRLIFRPPRPRSKPRETEEGES